MNLAGELMKWLDEQRVELTEEVIRLISDDAPKNKFSIVSGKIRMIDDVKNKIEALTLEDSLGQTSGKE